MHFTHGYKWFGCMAAIPFSSQRLYYVKYRSIHRIAQEGNTLWRKGIEQRQASSALFNSISISKANTLRDGVLMCQTCRRNSSLKNKKKPVLIRPKSQESKEVIGIWKNMTVQDLAKACERPLDHVYEAMLYVPDADSYDSATSQIDDLQVVREISKRLGRRTKIVTPDVAEPGSSDTKVRELEPRPISKKDLAPRPPVVAIMGHVDHGKTTLLDSLRDTRVAASEAGGITQHIGAFVVKSETGSITFLDTPGHAAFSALRQRGAHGADLVILVVAADDGVMEQTRESIRMIKHADVPMIVAINKIDKPDADIERTKRMLLQESIQLEDFGGDVQCVSISATKGTNLNTLVESLLVQAEVMNLQSENKGPVEGVVLESKIDPGRGRLCTALVQRGVLRKSSILVAGTAWAKVRGMFDELGKPLLSASPSTPVEIIGWRDLPSAGDKIYEVDSERLAKLVTDSRKTNEMNEKATEDAEVIDKKAQEHYKEYKAVLDEKQRMGRYKTRRVGPRTKEILEDTTTRLPVVVKADVDGSVEALLDVLDTYDSHNQCRLDIVHYGVGDVTENDVKLAETFGAHIYGFNVNISDALQKTCKSLNLEYRMSNIIYRLIEVMKLDIESKLPPKDTEEILGEANVLALFKVTEGKKKVDVAGCRCTKGILKRDSLFRLIRGEEILFEGPVNSMKHLKMEVDSIKNGIECGLSLQNAEVVPKEGDVLTCYRMVPVPQKSEWNPGF